MAVLYCIYLLQRKRSGLQSDLVSQDLSDIVRCQELLHLFLNRCIHQVTRTTSHTHACLWASNMVATSMETTELILITNSGAKACSRALECQKTQGCIRILACSKTLVCFRIKVCNRAQVCSKDQACIKLQACSRDQGYKLQACS